MVGLAHEHARESHASASPPPTSRVIRASEDSSERERNGIHIVEFALGTSKGFASPLAIAVPRRFGLVLSALNSFRPLLFETASHRKAGWNRLSHCRQGRQGMPHSTASPIRRPCDASTVFDGSGESESDWR
jgi:hypothetical protein